MKQMQLILNDKANEIVEIFKIRHKLRTKEEAVNQIIVMNGELL